MEKDIFEEMVERWPSAIVARVESPQFTGGTVTEKYLSNLDSQGKGPANRFYIGRKAVYPVSDFVAWLRARATAAGGPKACIRKADR